MTTWRRNHALTTSLWKGWSEAPGDLLRALDGLRHSATLPALSDLEPRVSGACLDMSELETPRFVLWFDTGACWTLAPPRPERDLADLEGRVSSDYLRLLAVTGGIEVARLDAQPVWDGDRAEVTVGQAVYWLGADDAIATTATLYGEDHLGAIRAEPEDYGFTPEHLARCGDGDMLAVYDDANSGLGVFHRQLEGPTGEPAFVLWMHDEPGGLFGRHLDHLDRRSFGDCLAGLLAAQVQDQDAFDLLF